MRKLDSDIVEMDEFISTWKINNPINIDGELTAKLKSSYKQFHSLLVWGLVSEKIFLEDDHIKLYFTELLSDLSHSLLLTLAGFYKPARSSLRSAIENSIRVFLISKKIDVSDILSVHELFGIAKKEFSDDRIVLRLLNDLHNEYGELCKSVHSAKIDYLSLTIPFEKLSIFQRTPYLSNVDKLRCVSSLLNQGVFWLWGQHLAIAGHGNEDIVRDSLPRGIKRAKAEC